LSIGAIARQVGFKDQTYFSRVFKQQMGLSPQAYREAPEELKTNKG
ncbi:MAG: AraC family transcriptional regulator, partial [Chloroflexi bacterium]|nr:AraC family transcriptional regulator [Chloroflexota bacterium]